MDTALYQTLLTARLKELTDRLQEIEEGLDEPVDKNWDEAAVEREDDEVLEALGESGLQEIRAIKAAMDRLEQGTYGVCVKCGEDISPERLKVVPTATLCRNCAA